MERACVAYVVSICGMRWGGVGMGDIGLASDGECVMT